MKQIPWDRIVHWFGRANTVPETVQRLWSVDSSIRQKAQADLAHWLEHQGGLSHATPFGIQLLIQALHDPKLPDRASVIAILEEIAKSALFQIEGPRYLPLSATIQDLISPKYLWPEFISEEEDEMLYEESDNEGFKLFQAVSAQVLINERAFFLKLAAENYESAAAAKRLLDIVEAIEKSYKLRVASENESQACPDIAWPEFADQAARYDWYRLVIAAYANLWEGHVSQVRLEPVGEAEIAKLEARIGCSLPQPLRNYHLEFGALRLAEVVQRWPRRLLNTTAPGSFSRHY
jgi:hypothetical protein